MIRGRKLKLTDAVIRDICDAFGIGASETIACAYAGISRTSYHNWRRYGREALAQLEADPDTSLSGNQVKYLKFFDKTEKARAYAAVSWLDVIATAAEHDPAWARFMLKCRYPEDYSETSRLDVTTDGQPLSVPSRFEVALKRAYSDDSTGQVPDGSSESELPAGSNTQLSEG